MTQPCTPDPTNAQRSGIRSGDWLAVGLGMLTKAKSLLADIDAAIPAAQEAYSADVRQSDVIYMHCCRSRLLDTVAFLEDRYVRQPTANPSSATPRGAAKPMSDLSNPPDATGVAAGAPGSAPAVHWRDGWNGEAHAIENKGHNPMASGWVAICGVIICGPVRDFAGFHENPLVCANCDRLVKPNK